MMMGECEDVIRHPYKQRSERKKEDKERNKVRKKKNT
jgi:hypothetical protein